MNRLGVIIIAAFLALVAGTPAETQYTSMSASVLCIVAGGSCDIPGTSNPSVFKNTDLHTYQTVFVAGYHNPGDLGGGTFTNTGSHCTNDNDGSIVKDGESPAICFQRINSGWGPKEFGAIGEIGGVISDDTTYLQKWLDANQPHMGDTDTYGVSSRLKCNLNTTIQGPENLQNSGTPLFNINALSTFSGTTYTSSTGYDLQGVIGAYDFCRLSGVAVTGNGFAAQVSGVQTTMNSNTITLPAPVTNLAVGNAIVGTYIPVGTVVTNGVTTTTLTISQAATGTTGVSGETVNFYGPDAVDVLGPHVTIDGFSLLSAGRYDLFCGYPGQQFGDVAVKDSFIQSALSDDIEIPGPCSNDRFIGDIVASAGGDGIFFSATEADIEGGVIEGSQAVGLHLMGAQRVSVTGMHIQGNGAGPSGGAGIEIDGSHTISICGNHLEGNGGDVANSAHILFRGAPDNVNLCGNVYEVQPLSDVALRPLYDYDTYSGTSVTNLHLYDSPVPQASGQVYSQNAAPILPQLQVPQVLLGQINGLALSNATTASAVNIAFGEASDSTSAATIMLPPVSPTSTTGCTVDLQGSNGPGGLDDGSAAPSTTYFYFLIASAFGSNPACIASGNMAPTFKHAPSYQTTVKASTYNGLYYLYNMSSVAGLAVGQTVPANTYLSAPATIMALGTLTTQATASIGPDGKTVTVPSTTNIAPGMAVSDVFQFSTCGMGHSARSQFPSQGETVASVPSSTTFVLSTVLTGFIPNDCMVISGGNTAQISVNPATSTNVNFTVYTGLYRMIAALYTTSSPSPNITVVPFMQDSDTFYLASSAADIATGLSACPLAGSGTSAISCALSVPCGRAAPTCSAPGLKVEAFGRLVGGNGEVLLSSLDQKAIQPPNLFSGLPPGFSTNSGSTNTSHPFRLYTDGNGNVQVQASAAGSAIYEDTDGWVLHR